MNSRLTICLCVVATLCIVRSAAAQLTGFNNHIVVANDVSYGPDMVDPTLRDAWGVAIRPAANGLGGHFWISSRANGTSNQYVGDVGATPIFQDALKNMDAPPYTPGFVPPVPSGPETFIPDGEGVARMTGQTWQQTPGFVITLEHINGTITNPAKFIFATEDGVISAWTDNKQPNGTPNWVGYSIPVIDHAADGAHYYGVTVSNQTGYLYAADLGNVPGIRVFNPDFSSRTDFDGAFNPFDGGDGVQPGEYAPFNVQTAQINGNGSLFVTYQKTKPDPQDSGSILPGLGELGTGFGRLAEFAPTGELVAVWDDLGLLNSPYGVALAPADFGPASNALLVANSGDGTIVAFDTATRTALGYLADASGQTIQIDGLKALTFGNGQSLGEANRLYYTAGPQGGSDGVLGSLAFAPVPEPSSFVLAAMGLGSALCLRRVSQRRRRGRRARP